MKDTVRVYLRNTSNPFAIVDSAKSVIDSVSFVAPLVFKYANSGTYYLQVIHRNALETWSKTGGEAITKGVFASYDFTSAQSQGYGSNLVLTGSYWLLYSGDVNKDGSIDGTDLSDIDNDAFNFESGYRVTDVNGDNTTDASDLAITDNNVSNFVSKLTPMTSPSDVILVKERMKIANEQFRKAHVQNSQTETNKKSK